MVQVIPPSERLRRLRSLRVELDAEIAAEEARLARASQVRQPAGIAPPRRVGPQRPKFEFDGDPFTAASSTIREWAHSRGIAIGLRGKVPAVVRDAFIEAHTARV